MKRLLAIVAFVLGAHAEQLAFDPVAGASSYEIERFGSDGVWRRVLTPSNNIVFLGRHPTGVFAYRVAAVGATGLKSLPSTIVFDSTNTGSALMYLPRRADRAASMTALTIVP